jgi:hypothetical protein
VKKTAGLKPRQTASDFDTIYRDTAVANEQIKQLTYDMAKATGGAPAFPPSTLDSFASAEGFQMAVGMVGAMKGKLKEVKVEIDHEKRKVLIFDPKAAEMLSQALNQHKPPPPTGHSNDRGIKGKERARQKAETLLGDDGRPDPGQLMDLARSTIKFDSIDNVYQALGQISKKFEIVKFKDRFQKPANGYRDIIMKIKMDNGHIGELQLHVGEILDIKLGEGHAIYKKMRDIDHDAEVENRPYTRKEALQIAKLSAQSQALYDAAYKKAMGKKAAA